MKPPKSVVIPIETYRAQPSHPACILLTPMSHDAYCVITPVREIISQIQSFSFYVTYLLLHNIEQSDSGVCVF